MDNLDAITSHIDNNVNTDDVLEVQIAGPAEKQKARTGENVIFTVTLPPLTIGLDSEGFDPDDKYGPKKYTTQGVVDFIAEEISNSVKAGYTASSAIIDIWCLLEDEMPDQNDAIITVRVE